MQDITTALERAIFSHTNWMISGFHDVILFLKENGIDVSFWTDEENWASLIIANQVSGYVWRKYPLIIFETNALTDLPALLNSVSEISYIQVENVLGTPLKISGQDLIKYLDGLPSIESFTAEDLWFYTNTS